MQEQHSTFYRMTKVTPPIAKICCAETLGTNFAVAANSNTEPKLLKKIHEDSQDRLNAMIDGEPLELQNDILEAYSQALLIKHNLMKFQYGTNISIAAEKYLANIKAKYVKSN